MINFLMLTGCDVCS